MVAMIRFVLDTSIFVNPDVRVKFGKTPTEAMKKFLEYAEKLFGRVEFYMSPGIYREVMHFVDESEVLTPADDKHHIDKWKFNVPFVCGARNLGEALRRISEGAAMIRTKGEAGTGNVIEAVKHIRAGMSEIRRLQKFQI